MTAANPWGGKRQGSGRKSLRQTKQYAWIVARVLEALETKEAFEERHQRWERRFRPQEQEARKELEEYRLKLKNTPIERRDGIAKNPFRTPLEDVQVIFELGQVSRWSHIPAPSQFDLSAAYEHVAAAASKKFGRRISTRQVKRCMEAWRQLEARLQD